MSSTPQETDRKVRKLTSRDPRNGQEMQQFQEGQNELLGIQAQQQQLLKEQQIQEQADQSQGQILAQAGELGAMSAVSGDGGGPVLQQQVAQMNPQTQAMLGKYGVKPNQPKVTRTAGREVKVTPAKIQITNNNITTTKNDIKMVTPPSSPAVVPVAATKEKDGQGTISRFKTWISNVFAKQKEESVVREKEYKKREWSLNRSSSRMMRGLEKLGKTFAERLDPRRLTKGNRLSQLQILFFIMAMKNLKETWPTLLGYVKTIEGWVTKARDFFGFNSKGWENSGLKNVLISVLGGEKGETLGQALTRLFWWDGNEYGKKKGIFNYLLDKLKEFFNWDERIKAVSEVKFDDISLSTGNDFIDSILGGFKGVISSLGQYIKDVFTALLTGKNVSALHASHTIRQEMTDSMTTGYGEHEASEASTHKNAVHYDDIHGKVYLPGENGKLKKVSVSYGDMATVFHNGGKQFNSLVPGDLDENKHLTNSYGASMRQSAAISDMFNRTGQTAKLMAGLENLQNRANKSGEDGVVVTKEFIDNLVNTFGFDKKKYLKYKEVKFVPRKRRDDEYWRYESEPGKGTALVTAYGAATEGVKSWFRSLFTDTENSNTNAISAGMRGAEAGYRLARKADDIFNRRPQENAHNMELDYDNSGLFAKELEGIAEMVPISDPRQGLLWDNGKLITAKMPFLKVSDFNNILSDLAEKYNLENHEATFLSDDLQNDKLSAFIGDTIEQKVLEDERRKSYNENKSKLPNTVDEETLRQKIYDSNLGQLNNSTFFGNKELYNDWVNKEVEKTKEKYSKRPAIDNYYTNLDSTFFPIPLLENEEAAKLADEHVAKRQEEIANSDNYSNSHEGALAKQRYETLQKAKEEQRKNEELGEHAKEPDTRFGAAVDYVGDQVSSMVNTATDWALGLVGKYRPTDFSKDNRSGKAELIRNLIKEDHVLGFNDTAISGILGVLTAESSLDPTKYNTQEYQKAKSAGYSDDEIFSTGKTGQGLAQWSNSRVPAMMDWYKKKYGKTAYPKDIPLEQQVEYIIEEMKGRGAFVSAMRKIPDDHSKESIIQAAKAMLLGFENGSSNALSTPENIDKKYGAGKYTSFMKDRVEYSMGWDKRHADSVGYVSGAGIFDADAINNVSKYIQGTGYVNPVDSGSISSGYKYREQFGRMHRGIDIKVDEGTEVKATMPGTVAKVGYEKNGYGNYIYINHPNNTQTRYAHLKEANVKEGQEVKAGEVIGLSGNTGKSTGAHLHYETRVLDEKTGKYKDMNPAEFTGLNYKEGQDLSKLDMSPIQNSSGGLFGSLGSAISGAAETGKSWFGDIFDKVSGFFGEVKDAIVKFSETTEAETPWELVKDPEKVINQLGRDNTKEFWQNLWNSKTNIPKLLTESDPDNEYKMVWDKVDPNKFQLFARKKKGKSEESDNPVLADTSMTKEQVDELGKENIEKKKEESEKETEEEKVVDLPESAVTPENSNSEDKKESTNWEKIDRDSLIKSFYDTYGDEFINEFSSSGENNLPELLNKYDPEYEYMRRIAGPRHKGKLPKYSYYRRKKNNKEIEKMSEEMSEEYGFDLSKIQTDAISALQEALGVKMKPDEIKMADSNDPNAKVDKSAVQMADNILDAPKTQKESINEIVKAGFITLQKRIDKLSNVTYQLAEVAIKTGNSYTQVNQTSNSNPCQSFTR